MINIIDIFDKIQKCFIDSNMKHLKCIMDKYCNEIKHFEHTNYAIFHKIQLHGLFINSLKTQNDNIIKYIMSCDSVNVLYYERFANCINTNFSTETKMSIFIMQEFIKHISIKLFKKIIKNTKNINDLFDHIVCAGCTLDNTYIDKIKHMIHTCSISANVNPMKLLAMHGKNEINTENITKYLLKLGYDKDNYGANRYITKKNMFFCNKYIDRAMDNDKHDRKKDILNIAYDHNVEINNAFINTIINHNENHDDYIVHANDCIAICDDVLKCINNNNVSELELLLNNDIIKFLEYDDHTHDIHVLHKYGIFINALKNKNDYVINCVMNNKNVNIMFFSNYRTVMMHYNISLSILMVCKIIEYIDMETFSKIINVHNADIFLDHIVCAGCMKGMDMYTRKIRNMICVCKKFTKINPMKILAMHGQHEPYMRNMIYFLIDIGYYDDNFGSTRILTDKDIIFADNAVYEDLDDHDEIFHSVSDIDNIHNVHNCMYEDDIDDNIDSYIDNNVYKSDDYDMCHIYHNNENYISVINNYYGCNTTYDIANRYNNEVMIGILNGYKCICCF